MWQESWKNPWEASFFMTFHDSIWFSNILKIEFGKILCHMMVNMCFNVRGLVYVICLYCSPILCTHFIEPNSPICVDKFTTHGWCGFGVGSCWVKFESPYDLMLGFFSINKHHISMCRANFTLFSCEFLRFFGYGWAYMTCVQTQPFLDGETVLLYYTNVVYWNGPFQPATPCPVDPQPWTLVVSFGLIHGATAVYICVPSGYD